MLFLWWIRQGTSFHFQIKYFDIFVNSTNKSTNIEMALLSWLGGISLTNDFEWPPVMMIKKDFTERMENLCPTEFSKILFYFIWSYRSLKVGVAIIWAPKIFATDLWTCTKDKPIPLQEALASILFKSSQLHKKCWDSHTKDWFIQSSNCCIPLQKQLHCCTHWCIHTELASPNQLQ